MIHSLFIPMALKGALFCGQQGDEHDDALLNTVDLTQKAPSGKKLEFQFNQSLSRSYYEFDI